MRSNIKKIVFIFIILMVSFFTACGDYKPCEVLAYRICEQCPSVADHWMAACLCIENGTSKENGFKCIDPEQDDKIRCNATLDNWNTDLCELLN